MALKSIVGKFNYYQQIRLLLRKLRDGHTPDSVLLNEKLQITSTLSLKSPNGQVENINKNDSRIKIVVSHNGLTGTTGALPVIYSEWMAERYYRYNDRSAKEFINIFEHRLYCLDYLAWQKNHICSLAESQEKQLTETAVLAVNGLLINSCPKQLSYAYLFNSSVRSMINLEYWLKLMYGVPAKIIPFTGSWKKVNEEECCQLGNPQQTLSTAPMIGTVRIETHSHFNVVLGPMSQEKSHIFFPQGNMWEDLWKNIHCYAGKTLEFSISLFVKCNDFKCSPLGKGVLGRDLYMGGYNEPIQYFVQLPVPKN